MRVVLLGLLLSLVPTADRLLAGGIGLILFALGFAYEYMVTAAAREDNLRR